MAKKRGAAYELNHLNWDQDIPERDGDKDSDAGRMLNKEELVSSGRVIRKARRSVTVRFA